MTDTLTIVMDLVWILGDMAVLVSRYLPIFGSLNYNMYSLPNESVNPYELTSF